MITERTLRKWRVEVLRLNKDIEDHTSNEITLQKNEVITLCERILRMSSELLDHHLLRRMR